MCIGCTFDLYSKIVHYKYKVKIKGARHMRHKLLNDINNDIIFKFSQKKEKLEKSTEPYQPWRLPKLSQPEPARVTKPNVMLRNFT